MCLFLTPCHAWLHQSVFVQNDVHTPLIIRISMWNHVMGMVLTRLLNICLRFSLSKKIISYKDFTHCHVVHYWLNYLVVWRNISVIFILETSTKTCSVSIENYFVPYTIIMFQELNVFSNCHSNLIWEMNIDNGIFVPFLSFSCRIKEEKFSRKLLKGKLTKHIPWFKRRMY